MEFEPKSNYQYDKETTNKVNKDALKEIKDKEIRSTEFDDSYKFFLLSQRNDEIRNK